MGRRPATGSQQDHPRSCPDARRGDRRSASRTWTRLTLAIGALSAFLAGCSVDLYNESSGNIPGPDPERALPADALNPLGPVAAQQDDLWDLTYLIAVGVFVLVFGGLAFILFRFRARGDDEPLPKQVHGNTKLEITWTLIPALILAGIAVPTVQTIFALAEEPADDAIIVQVVAKQYWWEFNYQDPGLRTASELHIPIGREVFIELDGNEEGADVLHSFWVPSLAGKRDYVPGAVRTLRIQADEPGVYPGLCAEFCGLSHANMRFTVIAHEPADYEAWLQANLADNEPPTEGLAAEGAVIAGQQCIGCHTFRGLPENADSRFGPDLTHFAQRAAFAGYILDTPYFDGAEPDAEENLRQWLADPQAVKPGAQMPNLGLSDSDIDALMAYLATLE